MNMLLLVALLVVWSELARAELGPPIPKDKKLIGFAADVVDPGHLKKHIEEIEERLPLDGLDISVFPDGWRWPRNLQQGIFFGGMKFSRDDFKQAVADSKATKFKRYTDNFIQVAVSATIAKFNGEPEGSDVKFYPGEAKGNLDWFDPNWSVIANNGAVLAWVAKEGGFKGIFLDVEHYKGSPTPPWKRIFSYELRPDKDERDFEVVAAQVRMRGREWMEAVTAVYPDITIVVIPDTGAWRRTKTNPPWQKADPEWALVPAFVEGILERRGKATIIDGIETAYLSNTYDTFKALREEAEINGFEDLQYALGIWVDAKSKRRHIYKGFYTEPGKMQKNYRSPWRLEQTLYDALTVADKYVWLYVSHGRYLFHPDLRRQSSICPNCPHGQFPQEYTNALRNCRKPHELNQVIDVPVPRKMPEVFAKLAKGKTLLRNGSFEEWRDAPKGWPEWSKWATDWSTNGTPRREEISIKDGSLSLALDNMRGYNWIEQTIPVAPCAGKTVLFGAWVRTSSRAMVEIELLDHADGKYTSTRSNHHPGDGSWHFLTGKRSIPANATGKLRFRFNLRPRLSGSLVYIDGAKAVIEE